MAARLIDGRAIAAALRARVAVGVAALRAHHGVEPGLAAVLVGGDPPSQLYVGSKRQACAEVGIASFEHRLPANAGLTAVRDLVGRLNADDRVDGILVQLPLPLSPAETLRVLAALDPAKDVDGFHPLNIGRLWSGDPGLVPCTPQGVMLLLESVHPEGLAGRHAVILGRSTIVGRPVAALLLAADCTVTMIHSRSRDAAALCRAGDIVVAATGRAAMVTAEWVKPGAAVIDVGISRIAGADGKARLVGDVDFAGVSTIAGAITPVPGGVGPMTIACLLRNTLAAAAARRGLADPVPIED